MQSKNVLQGNVFEGSPKPFSSNVTEESTLFQDDTLNFLSESIKKLEAPLLDESSDNENGESLDLPESALPNINLNPTPSTEELVTNSGGNSFQPPISADGVITPERILSQSSNAKWKISTQCTEDQMEASLVALEKAKLTEKLSEFIGDAQYDKLTSQVMDKIATADVDHLLYLHSIISS
jgi:hypothetical protein